MDSSVTVDTSRSARGGAEGVSFVTIWAGSRLIYGQLHLAWNIFIRVQVLGKIGNKDKTPSSFNSTKPSSKGDFFPQ